MTTHYAATLILLLVAIIAGFVVKHKYTKVEYDPNDIRRYTFENAPKLWMIAKMAYDDLLKIERMPEVYKVDMAAWHIGKTHYRPCKVCLAGSVMAMRLKVPLTSTVDPGDFDTMSALYYRLNAIDDLRLGNLNVALRSFYATIPGHPFMGFNYPLIHMAVYSQAREQFKEDFLKLIKFIKEKDL